MLKRILDLLLSIIALIVLMPFLFVMSVLVLIFHGWPILFSQKRPGQHETPFQMIKFRTMTNKKDENGNLLPDKHRITKLGAFLRKTSLDELPELFNVLKGEMSLVGPRPLLEEYLPYYSDREKKRHNVKPGITGLAQVNGRNYLSWDERLELDVQYVENWSLWLDMEILFKTIYVVFLSKGVSADTAEVEPSFVDYREKNPKLSQ